MRRSNMFTVYLSLDTKNLAYKILILAKGDEAVLGKFESKFYVKSIDQSMLTENIGVVRSYAMCKY